MSQLQQQTRQATGNQDFVLSDVSSSGFTDTVAANSNMPTGQEAVKAAHADGLLEAVEAGRITHVNAEQLAALDPVMRAKVEAALNPPVKPQAANLDDVQEPEEAGGAKLALANDDTDAAADLAAAGVGGFFLFRWIKGAIKFVFRRIIKPVLKRIGKLFGKIKNAVRRLFNGEKSGSLKAAEERLGAGEARAEASTVAKLGAEGLEREGLQVGLKAGARVGGSLLARGAGLVFGGVIGFVVVSTVAAFAADVWENRARGPQNQKWWQGWGTATAKTAGDWWTAIKQGTSQIWNGITTGNGKQVWDTLWHGADHLFLGGVVAAATGAKWVAGHPQEAMRDAKAGVGIAGNVLKVARTDPQAAGVMLKTGVGAAESTFETGSPVSGATKALAGQDPNAVFTTAGALVHVTDGASGAFGAPQMSAAARRPEEEPQPDVPQQRVAVAKADLVDG